MSLGLISDAMALAISHAGAVIHAETDPIARRGRVLSIRVVRTDDLMIAHLVRTSARLGPVSNATPDREAKSDRVVRRGAMTVREATRAEMIVRLAMIVRRAMIVLLVVSVPATGSVRVTASVRIAGSAVLIGRVETIRCAETSGHVGRIDRTASTGPGTMTVPADVLIRARLAPSPALSEPIPALVVATTVNRAARRHRSCPKTSHLSLCRVRPATS